MSFFCTACYLRYFVLFSFFFFTDTSTTEIYTLSLHDALPISRPRVGEQAPVRLRLDGVGAALVLGAVPVEERAHRSEEHTSELQSHHDLVCRLLLEKKKKRNNDNNRIVQVHHTHT